MKHKSIDIQLLTINVPTYYLPTTYTLPNLTKIRQGKVR